MREYLHNLCEEELGPIIDDGFTQAFEYYIESKIRGFAESYYVNNPEALVKVLLKAIEMVFDNNLEDLKCLPTIVDVDNDRDATHNMAALTSQLLSIFKELHCG